MLAELLEAVPVTTIDEAWRELTACRRIDLIVATFRFDDSQMIDFLESVKQDRRLKAIPFYCVRMQHGVIEDDLAERMGDVCIECGAAAFADISRLSRPAAARSVRTLLRV